MKKAAAALMILLVSSCDHKSGQNSTARKGPETPPQALNINVTGRWEWLIARGGHAGLDSITHREREPNSMIFDADGNYRSFIREQQVENGRYKLSLEKTGERDSVMTIHFATMDTVSGDYSEYAMLVSLRNDTLSLYPAGCSDCLSDYYKKSPR